MSHLQLVLGVTGFVTAWVGLGYWLLPELMVWVLDLPRKRLGVAHARD